MQRAGEVTQPGSPAAQPGQIVRRSRGGPGTDTGGRGGAGDGSLGDGQGRAADAGDLTGGEYARVAGELVVVHHDHKGAVLVDAGPAARGKRQFQLRSEAPAGRYHVDGDTDGLAAEHAPVSCYRGYQRRGGLAVAFHGHHRGPVPHGHPMPAQDPQVAEGLGKLAERARRMPEPGHGVVRLVHADDGGATGGEASRGREQERAGAGHKHALSGEDTLPLEQGLRTAHRHHTG
jgi:hypothetical protein